MSISRFLIVLFCQLQSVRSWDYCIIGAGPGGLQLAYYLQKAGLNYVILERNSVPGSFFEVYPRRRTLISINKRHTGETNTEFNMRHDWNSLLSDDPEMVFKHYSKEMFPPADTLLRYLQDYTEKNQLNVHYNTSVSRVLHGVQSFSLLTEQGDVYQCRFVVMSTGISVLNRLLYDNKDLVQGYDTVSHDPEDYEGKKVLILGKGNSAFETADLIYGRTDHVHLISRDRVKLSWNTHYVGDVRGVNNNLLDTYQLKSLDALMEADLNEGSSVFEQREGQIFFSQSDHDGKIERGPYDIVINCLGFKYDSGPLSNLTGQEQKPEKYPQMGWDFQSTSISNLYFAGTITHGLDRRMSSGGFIHGFRYTARSLAHILAARNHRIRWPTVSVPLSAVVAAMTKRLNEMSGPYQMFYVLVDVYVRYGDRVDILQDVPHGMLHRVHELLAEARSSTVDMIVTRLEYGADYSKVGGDPFRVDRVELDPYRAHTCNFIHPVVYHFTTLPHVVPVKNKALRGASSKIHLVEDLYTDFGTLSRHIGPLSNFIGTVWQEDLQFKTPPDCLRESLTRVGMSGLCQKRLPVVAHGFGSNQVRISPKVTAQLEFDFLSLL